MQGKNYLKYGSLFLLLMVFISLVGCGGTTSTSSTVLSTPTPAPKVTLYSGNYAGIEARFGVGIYSVDQLNAVGLNDCISSMRVPSGLSVFVFTDNLSGTANRYTSDVFNLAGSSFQDSISAVVIVAN